SKAKGAADAASVHCETLLREVTGKRIADVIVEQAQQHACDLIVMGTHGRKGFTRLTLGSAAEGVARSSPVPVLLVRLEDAKP
ncbi:MAG TPA: universal stress protein, partial [Ramlibacter sp.]